MNWTCAQKRLLLEADYTTCPACKSTKAYQNFYGKWECPEAGCANFSSKQQDAVYTQFKKAKALRGLQLPTKEEWRELDRAHALGKQGQIQTNLKNGYRISTKLHSWISTFETLVFNPKGIAISQNQEWTLDKIRKVHIDAVKRWAQEPTKKSP
jgi:hypothetical protein